MALVEVTEQENIVLEAARAYAEALAVVRGTPPFSARDAAKIVTTREQLLSEAKALADGRKPGPSISDDGPMPPDLMALIKRFWPAKPENCES